jgi:hypothetical protein
MLAFILAVAIGQAAAPQVLAAFDASRSGVSPPRVVAEVDGGMAKGEPVGLSWAADGSTLYLRTAEYDRWRNEQAHHLVVTVTGGGVTVVDAVPPWAATYWMWKSGQVAPGVPDMRLETDAQTQMATATGSVRDGGLSQSRADPTQSQVTTDLASVQQTATITIRLKGTVVAQSVNKPMAPGSTWGWAPAPLGGLAFVDAKKRLALIDRAGKTLDVAGTADVMLPAWSPDGKRIAFLQRKGRKNFVLSVVEVEAR